ncbi:acyl-CoA dehydrogenase, partial [Streptomyces rubellomurinus subsp. indigoferus]
TKPLRAGVRLDNPVFAAKLGQMELQIDVMKSHLLPAGRDYDAVMATPDAADPWHRQGTRKSALTGKMFCGQTGWDIATVGSEMFGGIGKTHESPSKKLRRDSGYVSIV